MKTASLLVPVALLASGIVDLRSENLKTLDDFRAAAAKTKAVIIKESNANEKMRAAAENAVKQFQDWAVGIDYREDVYKALKAFADTKPNLSGEDKKLFDETMRDYRRAGLELPPDKRKEVE